VGSANLKKKRASQRKKSTLRRNTTEIKSISGQGT
jgi:hypothetical protein